MTSSNHTAPAGPSSRSNGAGVDYSSRSYWQTRFAGNDRRENGGRGFEWLHDGVESLLDPASEFLSSLSPHPRQSDGSEALRQKGRKRSRVLHIGMGSSSLSSLFFDRVKSSSDEGGGGEGGGEVEIVNVDFAQAAVDAAAARDGGRGMRYTTANLLVWADVRALLHLSSHGDGTEAEGEGEGYDVILDKSTTDSISTGADIAVRIYLPPPPPEGTVEGDRPPDPPAAIGDVEQTGTTTTYHLTLEGARTTLCPAVVDLVTVQSPQAVDGSGTGWTVKALTLSPVHVLSLHMAALSRHRSPTHGQQAMAKGSRWYCLSYSAERWRDVLPLGGDEREGSHAAPPTTDGTIAGWPWRVIDKKSVEVVDAPSPPPVAAHVEPKKAGKRKPAVPASSPVVFTPAVFHTAYVLEFNGAWEPPIL